MVSVNLNFEPIKMLPKYVKEYCSSSEAYAVVSKAVTSVTKQSFKNLAVVSGLIGVISIAYIYREKISVFYQTCLNVQILALALSALAVPFLGMTFAVPAAAALSLGIIKYEMQQVGTIRFLQGLNALLIKNNGDLNERLKASDEIVASIEETIKAQIGTNEKLAILYATIQQNTSRLEAIAGKDVTAVARLSMTLKQMCVLLTHIEKEGLIEDVIEASNLAKKIEEGQAKLLSIEKAVAETTEKMQQSNSRLTCATTRLVNAVSMLEHNSRGEIK